jgi:hypothetical protein
MLGRWKFDLNARQDNERPPTYITMPELAESDCSAQRAPGAPGFLQPRLKALESLAQKSSPLVDPNPSSARVSRPRRAPDRRSPAR